MTWGKGHDTYGGRSLSAAQNCVKPPEIVFPIWGGERGHCLRPERLKGPLPSLTVQGKSPPGVSCLLLPRQILEPATMTGHRNPLCPWIPHPPASLPLGTASDERKCLFQDQYVHWWPYLNRLHKTKLPHSYVWIKTAFIPLWIQVTHAGTERCCHYIPGMKAHCTWKVRSCPHTRD